MSAKTRVHEKWQEVVTELNLDLREPVNFVDAKQVKRITGEEPRIIAKMDSQSDMPALFRDNGVFVLPINNHTYAIVRGRGYHSLESIVEPPSAFSSTFPFRPVAPSVGGGEMQFVDWAYNSGLLERFLRVDSLFLMVRGRKFSPPFSFRVGGSPTLHVDGVQVEIDGGFEGEHTFVALEAKVNRSEDFIVRQLYYPFRFWQETFRAKGATKEVRPIFFVYDSPSETYNFWEYRFQDPADYESIQLLRSSRYLLSWEPLNLRHLESIRPDFDTPRRQIVPQADDVSKIAEIPFLAWRETNTAAKVADYFGFDKRQSSYYSQAAEALGLVALERGRYELTDQGEEFVHKPSPARNEILCRMMLRLPVFNEALTTMLLDPKRTITKLELSSILRRAGITGTTVGRRTRTLLAWFEWMERTFGVVEVEATRVSLSRHQRRLDE